VRIVPYRTVDNVIDGVVLTFVEITDQKRAQALEEQVTACLQGMLDTVHEAIMVLGPDLKVTSANRSFYEIFHLKLEDVEGHLIYEIGNGQWDVPALRGMLASVIDKDAQFENSLIEHDFPDTGIRKMLVNARRVRQSGIRTDMILLTIKDVTGK